MYFMGDLPSRLDSDLYLNTGQAFIQLIDCPREVDHTLVEVTKPLIDVTESLVVKQ
jgi:hypothetical protein